MPPGRELHHRPGSKREHMALAHQAFLAGDRIGVRHGGPRRGARLVGAVAAARRAASRPRAPVHDDAPTRWRSGPMAHAFRSVEDELTQIAHDGDFVAAVTDETGAIVWVAGGRTMRRRAEEVAFLPGGRWDEAAVGTNALALALSSGRPWAVRATRHFSPMVQDWVCYSAPIHDPATARRSACWTCRPRSGAQPVGAQHRHGVGPQPRTGARGPSRWAHRRRAISPAPRGARPR
ncbi:MAG: hypothetical protein R2713_15665 [Ilumatobacteraceae bacterium]